MIKKFLLLLLAVTYMFCLFATTHSVSAASFNNNHIMDDAAFNNNSTMTAAQIDSFLNSQPKSCISTHKGFSSVEPTGYSPGGGFKYGSRVSAGTIIYDASRVYGINPQVLLSTLQKEQTYVTGPGTYDCTNPTTSSAIKGYTQVMGYGCPDSGTTHSYSTTSSNPALKLQTALYYINGVAVTSVTGTCVNTNLKAGFTQQVIRAAWLLKFGQQRSLGNISWNVQLNNFPHSGNVWDNSDDPQSCYGGPVTQGMRQVCPSGATVFYDGYTTIDGTAVHIDTGATAALYWYTPHFSGNQHFFSIYVSWFGNPNSPCFGTSNVSSADAGRKIISYQSSSSGPPNLTYSRMNDTGSTCTEAHLWNAGYKSWDTHIVTGMKATDPAGGTLLAGNFFGGKQDRMLFMKYTGRGSSTEVHLLSSDLKKFPGVYDVPTTLTNANPTTGTFVAGDFLGRGYDQLLYIRYGTTGANAEIHMFSKDLRKVTGTYDVRTNLTNISGASGAFAAGDFLHKGYAQLAYIRYHNIGNLEIHVFDRSLRNATGTYDVTTNLSSMTADRGTFVSGDYLGRGYDQLLYILYSGGSGRVEVHTFSPDLRVGVGYQDIATNLGAITPPL